MNLWRMVKNCESPCTDLMRFEATESKMRIIRFGVLCDSTSVEQIRRVFDDNVGIIF